MICPELEREDAARLEEMWRMKTAKGAFRRVSASVEKPVPTPPTTPEPSSEPTPEPAGEPTQGDPSPEAETTEVRRTWGRQVGRLDIPAFDVDDVGERVRKRRDHKWTPKDGA
ncbi:hypothetical protein [Paludisphaera mucosa]|uniref:Uncharacterized protein n=1 Tax=Paludisphaera mucosa TaxID=3030827 RepID=A0ABT6FL78_9BACT|nr:hypothetical protein [Paludisphaera mucosa]MDG3008337.1 hypothetical protein [Paludisphaera mucosa]